MRTIKKALISFAFLCALFLSANVSSQAFVGSSLSLNGIASQGVLGESEFSPIDISGLSAWYDAADTATITQSGGSVSQWDDKSGNDNHVTQSTVSARPSTGVNIINSNNVLTFDGVLQFLNRSDALGFTGNPDITIIVVNKNLDVSSTRTNVFLGHTTGAAGQCLYTYDNDASFRYNNGNQVFTSPVVNTVNISVWQRASGSNYDQGKFFRNGVEQSQVSSTNPTNTPNIQNQRFMIGATINGGAEFSFFYGDVAEILIYNNVLTSEEMNKVGNYLKDKWGATWTNL